MKLITLCLIVKNEERFLNNCLEPFRNSGLDIIITDTGSTDNTLNIAEKYTSKIFQFPFKNNFSDARNWTLDQVNTPWVLFIDADEILDLNQLIKLKEQVFLLDKNKNVEGCFLWRYNFFANGGWYTSKELKLFRSDTEIRYEGSIGESVKGVIQRRGKKLLQLPIILNHFGHTRPTKVRDRKSYQYIDLMKAEVKKNPNNSKLIGYQGLIYRTVGDFKQALEHVEMALKIDPNSSHAHFCFAQVQRALGKNEEALRHYEIASQHSPNDPLYLNMVGVMQMCTGKHQDAEITFKNILKIAPCLTHIKVNLGLLALLNHDFEHANGYFEEVYKENPYFFYIELSDLNNWDPFRQFYFDTILNYSGLSFYHSYTQKKLNESKKEFQNFHFLVEPKYTETTRTLTHSKISPE